MLWEKQEHLKVFDGGLGLPGKTPQHQDLTLDPHSVCEDLDSSPVKVTVTTMQRPQESAQPPIPEVQQRKGESIYECEHCSAQLPFFYTVSRSHAQLGRQAKETPQEFQ